jgi:serine/threonine protein kinase
MCLLICRLEYLHSKRIVHRDVKTENMLLDNQKNLKIADFGVARVEARNPKDMTGETGTLGYMAPEVKRSLILLFNN